MTKDILSETWKPEYTSAASGHKKYTDQIYVPPLNKNETKYTKQQFSNKKQHRTMIPEIRETKKVSSTNDPARVPRQQRRDRNPYAACGFLELEMRIQRSEKLKW